MCGIVCILPDKKGDREKLEVAIREMTSRLTHRGPDEQGHYVTERVALGHRRLSIIDLKTGQQPMFSKDGHLGIIFNGEIYNFPVVRTALIARGYDFATTSDTETILHAYQEWGEECVQRLNGMFAFCIWDARDGSIFAARDRLGEKPFFWARQNGQLVIASEMKAILANPSFDRAMDDEAVAAYFTYSYIPAPLTIYRGIRKLPPGYCLTARNGAVGIRKYWDVVFSPDRTKSEKDFVHESMEILREAVRTRLMSEVPLGAFLSGGIDSSAVVALMSLESNEPVRTFTIGFGGAPVGFDDERRYAREVAERYKTQHSEYEVNPTMEGIIEEIVRSFDEPFADDATIPSYFVCKTARENVTVALSGLGGDEDFCGYERYLGFRLGNLYQLIPGFVRNGIIRGLVERIPEFHSRHLKVDHLKRFVRSSAESPAQRYFGYVSRIRSDYRDVFFSNAAQGPAEAVRSAVDGFQKVFDSAPAEGSLNKVFYWDMKTYLPEDILACTDRMSMRHSLEVRVPFLDHELVEYCARIPPEMKMRYYQKKYLLRKGVSRLLPRSILAHRKQGFVGPMAQWLQRELKDLTARKLSPENLEKHGLLNVTTVRRILDEHYSGRENNDTLIWSLLVFQTWFELYHE